MSGVFFVSFLPIVIKVDRLRNSRHIQGWVAASLVRIEPKVQSAHGWQHLQLLRDRMQNAMRNRLQRGSGLITTKD